MAIARRLKNQGHDVQVVCASADRPPGDLDIVVLPVTALTNHGRNAAFSQRLAHHVDGCFDVVAGFDALDGLDLLYCANPPVRIDGLVDRLNPRKRGFLKRERACFGPQSRTRLLLLSDAQRADYQARWQLESARVVMIPPTIERARIVSQDARRDLRLSMRVQLGVTSDQMVWLFVGSFPHTKGFDRIVEALPHFPAARVLCVGPREADAAPFCAQAARLGVDKQIAWLGSRDDIGALMVASDVLVHPSRLDITGTVILEALANGVPVIATAVCGYAPHIEASHAGRVIATPFTQDVLVDALRVDGTTLEMWRGHADRYARETDLTSGLDVAAGAIAATTPRSRR